MLESEVRVREKTFSPQRRRQIDTVIGLIEEEHKKSGKPNKGEEYMEEYWRRTRK